MAFTFKPRQIDRYLLGGRLAVARANTHCFLLLVRLRYEGSHGPTFQMSAAYSAMVRSLENLPEPATVNTAIRDCVWGGDQRVFGEEEQHPSILAERLTTAPQARASL